MTITQNTSGTDKSVYGTEVCDSSRGLSSADEFVADLASIANGSVGGEESVNSEIETVRN